MNFISKEDIKKFPLIKFTGEIHMVDDKKDVLAYCQLISESKIIGFDTETKPSFKKGVIHDISLVQLSVDDNVYLFRINKLGFCQELIDILANPNILKVGIDVKNDLSSLRRMYSFNPSNFLDLNQLALKNGFKSIGAVKLSIMLLGFRISKNQRLSDWSSEVLTKKQQEYAAIDAWICPKIFNIFKSRNYLL